MQGMFKKGQATEGSTKLSGFYGQAFNPEISPAVETSTAEREGDVKE